MMVKKVLRAVGDNLVLGLFFISALVVLFISEIINRQMANYEKIATEMTALHLKAAVRSLALLVDAETLDLFHTVGDMDKPEYQRVKDKIIQFGKDYNVHYAYYWRAYGKDTLQFIVDNDLDSATVVGTGSFERIRENAEFAALSGGIGVSDLGAYKPEWVGFLSAFAPVYGKDGKVYCVAGVDISDEFIFTQREDARNMKLLQFAVIPISILLGIINMMLYRRKAKQIEAAHIRLQYFNNNMRRAFATYLSEDVVEKIVSDPTRLQLGGEKRHMTAIFTDIEGFTSTAEALNPERLVELLNYYLSTMSDVILEKEGTIDKYEGDAIVAFFGAPIDMPDHALRACVTAIAMKKLEGEINAHIKKHDLSYKPLFTRIGINSGDMVVGNMGTHKKMNYTIVSNAVNLASRLEGMNKHYGTWILASAATIRETHDKLLTRKLDWVRVVGINEPVRIYEVLETSADAPKPLRDMVNLFAAAHDLFEERKWDEAEAAFRQVLAAYPEDRPSRLYLGRCEEFRRQPPARDWDGVFSFKEK